ncbi:GH25 family lysozyme [Furfurilactobacillus sp. WILCCON 0119]
MDRRQLHEKRRRQQRGHRFLHWLIGSLIVVGLCGGGYALVHAWQMRHQATLARYPITGAAIDQEAGFLDFQALAKTGLKFAYLKTTVGNRYLDDAFSGNYNRSLGSTLKIGVYLIYSPSSSVQSQVDYFERQVGSSTGSLPIMIAVPNTGASFDSDQAVKRTAGRLKLMMKMLEDDYQQDVGIWTFPAGYTALKDHLVLPNVALDDDQLNKRSPKQVQFMMYNDAGTIVVAGKRQSLSLMVYNGTKQSFENE